MTATTVREVLLTIARHNAAVQMAGPPRAPDSAPRRARRRTSYVLVVEDDPDIRDVVHQVLTDCGYRVRAAKHGGEAIDILKDEYMRPQAYGDEPVIPSAILLDVHMPVKDGFEFLKHLWQHMPQFNAVPIVPMSDSQSVTEFTRWAIQTQGLDAPLGALPKPFSRDMLIERVAEHAGLPPDSDPGEDDER